MKASLTTTSVVIAFAALICVSSPAFSDPAVVAPTQVPAAAAPAPPPDAPAPTTPVVPPPGAAPPAVAPTAVDSHSAAVQLLQAMDAKLASAKALSYATDVSFKIPSAAGKEIKFSCTGTVDKAGDYYVSLGPVGVGQENVYFDGKNVTVFNNADSTYCTSPGGASTMDHLRAVMIAALSVFPKSPFAMSELQLSMTLQQAFTTGHYLDTNVANLTSASDTLDGRPVVDLTESVATSAMQIATTYVVDPSTDEPISYSMNFKMGVNNMALSESITSLTLLPEVAPASTYAFVPPAGSKLVAAIKFPSAPANQAAAPSKLLAAGKTAPNFTVLSAKGAHVKLSSFAGKVVVLDFWATWCGPCQESLPHTDKIAKAYLPKGVVFLPICTWDDKSSFTAWLKSHTSMAMSFYYDTAGQNGDSSIATKLYNVDGIPTQYVIGKNGRVQTSFVGYDSENDPDESSLKKALNKALAAP